MPPLENAKHERFAQELAAGKTAVDAYEAAGYRHNEKRLSQMPPEERRAYIADLLGRAREAIERQRLIVLDRERRPLVRASR